MMTHSNVMKAVAARATNLRDAAFAAAETGFRLGMVLAGMTLLLSGMEVNPAQAQTIDSSNMHALEWVLSPEVMQKDLINATAASANVTAQTVGNNVPFGRIVLGSTASLSIAAPVTKPSFQSLWNNYPLGDSDAVKKLIGGKVNATWYTNTCTIRASRAFNYSNALIPGPTAAKAYGMNVISGSDNRWYAYRVREFDAYMTAVYGAANITVVTTGPLPKPIPTQIKGKRGIIEFVVDQWDDATGHFDVWDGTKSKYKSYFNEAKSVKLWTF